MTSHLDHNFNFSQHEDEVVARTILGEKFTFIMRSTRSNLAPKNNYSPKIKRINIGNLI